MILIKINKKKLLKIINKINLIFKKKNNKNENNLIIIKKKYKIFFLSYNLNKQIKIKLKTKWKLKYKLFIIIPINNFLKIIKNFKNKKIKILFIKNKIFFKQKNIKYTIKNIKLNNKNIIKFKKENNTKININKFIINYLINSIYFIINKNKDIKTNNTLIFFNKNNIKIITTDKYRIIYDAFYIKNKIKIKRKILISNEILLIIKEIINNTKKLINIKIKINKFQIKFKIKNLEIISDIILKKFPKLKEKINKKYKDKFSINKKKLLLSIKRCIMITKNKNSISKWLIKKNILTIYTKSDLEIGKEILKINYNKKKILKINNNYILDLISNIKEEKIVFNFNLNNKNIIILIPKRKNFKYIITQTI